MSLRFHLLLLCCVDLERGAYSVRCLRRVPRNSKAVPTQDICVFSSHPLFLLSTAFECIEFVYCWFVCSQGGTPLIDCVLVLVSGGARQWRGVQWWPYR